MKTKLIATGLMASAILSPCGAIAATAPTKPAPTSATGSARDVRCLMLANMYAKVSAAAQGKEAAGQARLFYLGRVSGRLPSAQLAATMATQAKTIDPATAGKDMTACVATVQSSAASIEAAGSKVRATIPAPPVPIALPPAGPPATPGNTTEGR